MLRLSATGAAAAALLQAAGAAAAIDRQAVVQRHAIVISTPNGTGLDPFDVLSVGNGDFGFNVDATGLQSLNDTYSSIFDLSTLSGWQFHSLPWSAASPRGAIDTYKFAYYDTPTGLNSNRSVPYATNTNISGDAYNWMHTNPHRFSLAQLALRLWSGDSSADSAPIAPSQLANSSRTQDLWSGSIQSLYTLSPNRDGSAVNVNVTTLVHPDVDILAVRLFASSAAAPVPLSLRIAFPYATGAWGPSAADWRTQFDGNHVTSVVYQRPGYVTFDRTLDYDGYRLDCQWSDVSWQLVQTGTHAFEVRPGAGSDNSSSVTQDLRCLFSPRGLHYPIGMSSQQWLQDKAAATAAILSAQALPTFDATASATAAMWKVFWQEGAFVDIAGGTANPAGHDSAEGAPVKSASNGVVYDANAFELERRVILSLYLTRVNSAGASPPQETGLLCNSWSGKHHGEMRYWHQGHWPVWGRSQYLARSDGFYADILQNSSSYAAFQGYDGARWPKMTAEVNNRSGIDVPWLGEACVSCDGSEHSGTTAVEGRALRHRAFDAMSGASAYNLMLWESVNTINPVLVWEQPHSIWLAELQRRSANATGGPGAAMAVMTRLAPIVFATARFQASFVYWNESSGTYNMGPPIMGGEEEGSYLAVNNPTFELSYWAVTLDIANDWLQTMSGQRNASWDHVVTHLQPRAIDEGSPAGMPLYSFNGASACCFLKGGYKDPGCPATAAATKGQCNPTQSHPLVIGQYGMINGYPATNPGRYGLDLQTLNNTVYAVLTNWSWGGPSDGANVWGWDFPLLAQSMTRLRWDPMVIVQRALLMPVQKNVYLRNGYNFQTSSGGSKLPAYLPGNGGLLLAVAMMAAGTDSSPAGLFPPEWGVIAEGFNFA